jgi:hypothetical protein
MMTTSSSLVLLLKAWKERSAERSYMDHCWVTIISRWTFWEGMIRFT